MQTVTTTRSRYAKPVFQRMNGLAEARPRNTQLSRRLGKIPMLRNRHKGAQLSKLTAPHASFPANGVRASSAPFAQYKHWRSSGPCQLQMPRSESIVGGAIASPTTTSPVEGQTSRLAYGCWPCSAMQVPYAASWVVCHALVLHFEAAALHSCMVASREAPDTPAGADM